jgi:hypothetical protein
LDSNIEFASGGKDSFAAITARQEYAGFYGVFGFAAFWLIVIAGKHLRKVLMREEDYYDR